MFSIYTKDLIKRYPLMPKEDAINLLSSAYNGCEESRNDLVMGHIEIIPQVIKIFKIPPGLSGDDLFQEGIIAMLKLIDGRKVREPGNIRYNLRLAIFYHLSKYVKKFKRDWITGSLNEEKLDEFGETYELLDIMPDPNDYLSFWEKEEDIKIYLTQVNQMAQTVLILTYGLFNFRKLTHKEVGLYLDCSESKVARIKKESEIRLMDLRDKDLIKERYPLIDMELLRRDMEV